MTDFSGITLAVIAGGKGRRMGFAKGELRLGQRGILEYLIERFAWTGPTLLVTAPGREYPPGWEKFDREVSDEVRGGGPLQGILTALRNIRTAGVIVTTVDMPGVGREQLSWFTERLAARPECCGVMTRRIVEGEIQIEPFPLACRVDAAEIISQRLAGGYRSVHSLLDLPEFVAEPAPGDWPEEVWTNVNTPGDWEAFLKKDRD
jgi:molybdopterin-guanine dinucleotide biosynthesis protein A